MVRTMVCLDESLHRWIRWEAEKRGRPLVEVVREALQEYRERKGKRQIQRAAFGIVGLGRGPAGKTSEIIHEAFREAARQKGIR